METFTAISVNELADLRSGKPPMRQKKSNDFGKFISGAARSITVAAVLFCARELWNMRDTIAFFSTRLSLIEYKISELEKRTP